jgi:hypothetical protein
MNNSNLTVYSSGESNYLALWKNSDVTAVDPVGIVNLQKTDPGGAARGAMTIGYYQSANVASYVVASEYYVDVLIQKAGTWRTAATFHHDGLTIPMGLAVGDIGFTPGFGDIVGERVRAEVAFAVKDGVGAPSTASGIAWIYVDSADGDLKVKFGDGVIKTLATDS